MNIGVILAGGVGSRCGLVNIPKQFVKIDGKPIIVYVLQHFEKCNDIDMVVVACIKNWIPYLNDLVEEYSLSKVASIVEGGSTSQESAYNGLIAAKEISGDENSVVLIHDGVRPLISEELLTDNINAVKEFGSSITCSRITETPIRVNDEGIIGAFSRSDARVAKAPQCFWLNDILEAHEAAKLEGKNDYIDSCSLMMNYKHFLHYTECDVDNIKVTEAEDIYLLRAMFRAHDDVNNFSGGDLK